ncbi:hypothetical protein ACFLXN_02995 [Chloroflexota bacterium]
MLASVTSFQIKENEINEAIDVYENCVIPKRKLFKGNCGGYILINRSSGKGFAITLWDTIDDYQTYSINEHSDDYREQLQKFKDHFASAPISLGQYEVCTNG